jgi:hypothetical protein
VRGGASVDVFGVRDRLIDNYREFTGNFVDIHDKTIREHIAKRIANGYQWPDSWLPLNLSFAPGGSISGLMNEDLMQPKAKGESADAQRVPQECR